jgi:hypothetical protein
VISTCKKQRFRRFLGQKVWESGRFVAIFVHSAWPGRLIWLLWLLPPPLPLPIVGAPSSSCAALTVSSSFWVKTLSFRLRSRHDLETLSLLFEKSYMTSSRKATSIHIATQFRVKIVSHAWAYGVEGGGLGKGPMACGKGEVSFQYGSRVHRVRSAPWTEGHYPK